MRRWRRSSPDSNSCRARLRRPPTRNRRLLVLGLGNVLCTDDGLGTVVVEVLMRDYQIPEEITVADGGTLGLSLLPVLQEHDAAIFVDAVRKGTAAPGTLIRIDGDEVLPAVRQHLSVHQIGVADLLDAARLTGSYPSELVLLGLVPENVDVGLGLSDPVRRALPRLIEAVVGEVSRFGRGFQPRCRFSNVSPTHSPNPFSI